MRYRVLALMTAAQAGASLIQQGLGSLAPVLVAAFALNKAQLGILFMTMQLGSALFTTPSGIVVDRFGERRALAWCSIAMFVTVVVATLVPAYPWFAVWLALFGAGYAASTPAGGRAILAWFTTGRGFAMGVRQTGVPAGGFLGGLLLPPAAAAFGYRGALVAAAVVSAAICLTVAALYREPPLADEAEGVLDWRALARNSLAFARDSRFVLVMIASMILVSAQGAMNAFVALTATNDVGLGVHAAALAFAVGQGSAIAGRLWWGFASDRLFGADRLLPMAIICVLSAVASVGLALAGRGAVALLFGSAALLGFTGVSWNGLMAAALVEIGGAQRAGIALGVPLTGVFVAGAIAPTVFGAIADASSLATAWSVLAALSFVGLGPALAARNAIVRARAKEAA